MNIKDAKDQIKKAVVAYMTKDKFGDYEISAVQQRPIFLMGPPGIGKTAIMEQIAQELDIAIVSYSMTHHTRQSALGLPFIEEKNYGGQMYKVSEYTMSEILASVYDVIEETGKKEGILFLDEINCVSETLAPSMLQFLQYKTFGRHRVPEGWIVVTAGNPAEYNNSVHDFDIATWDRLKRIDVEPDYKVWKEYAINVGVHPSITTYLDIKKDDFYAIQTTVEGKTFVTARGWVDLSKMIYLFEKNDFKVDETLVIQYLQNRRVAKDFAVYYDLFKKYQSDYKVEEILTGKASDEIKQRAQHAQFDERIALLGLLINALYERFHDVADREEELRVLMRVVKEHSTGLKNERCGSAGKELRKMTEELNREISKGRKAGAMSAEQIRANKMSIELIDSCMTMAIKDPENKTKMDVVKESFNNEKKNLEEVANQTKLSLDNVFLFSEEVFGSGNETLILVTELTSNYYSAQFISRYGSEEYFKHNKELLFYERQKEIIRELEKLELEDSI